MLNYQREYENHILSVSPKASVTLHNIRPVFKMFLKFINDLDIKNDVREWDADVFHNFYIYLNDYTYKKLAVGSWRDKSNRKYKDCHLKPRVIFSYQSIMKQFMKYLSATGKIFTNPYEQITFNIQNKKTLKRCASETDINKLTSILDTNLYLEYRNRVIIETLYGTGIRLSEITGLNIDDVNLTEGILFIRQGKFSKDRMVPIGDVPSAFLSEYIKNVRPYLLSVDNMQEIALFISCLGKRLSQSSYIQMLSQYAKKAGIKSISTHTFRHSFSVHMLKSGCDVRYISDVLGHSHLETTVQYTHIVDNDLREKVLKYHPCKDW